MKTEPHDRTVTRTASPAQQFRRGFRQGLYYLTKLQLWLERGLTAAAAHPLPIFLLSLAVPFLTSFVHAHRAPLSHDEYYTAYLSRLPDWHSVWRALNDGADVTPPLFVLITRASVHIFGSGNLGLRLPGLLGGWLMIWCIYRFMRNVVPLTYACLAALMPVLTIAFERHFCDARPYGLLLGATGIAILCWQRRSAFGLTLALGVATAVHYFALTLIGPLALAEGARWWKQRKMNWPMLVTLLAPFAVVVAHWPLIPIAVQTYGDRIGFRTSFGNVLTFYRLGFGSLLIPLVLALVARELCRLFGPPSIQEDQSQLAPYPARGEWALALGLAALPGLTIVVVALTFQIIATRYTIAGVLGVSLLAGLSAAWIDQRRCALGFSTLLVIALCTIYTGIQYRHTVLPVTLPNALQAELRASGETMLVSRVGLYVRLHANVPTDLQAQLWYAYDQEAVRSHHEFGTGKTFALENAIFQLSKWAPLHVIAFEEFLAAHPTFLVYGTPNDGWLLPELKRRQATITLQGWYGTRQLYRCDLPKIETQNSRNKEQKYRATRN